MLTRSKRNNTPCKHDNSFFRRRERRREMRRKDKAQAEDAKMDGSRNVDQSLTNSTKVIQSDAKAEEVRQAVEGNAQEDTGRVAMGVEIKDNPDVKHEVVLNVQEQVTV